MDVLQSIVGLEGTSATVRNVINKYGFSENPKRKGSWGSGFGIFLEIRGDRIQVGFRPPSDATNMQTYAGQLPMGLKAGDPIKTILQKLGTPRNTAHDPKVYYEMTFDGVTVYTMNGVLFEVWLTAHSNKAEPTPGGDRLKVPPQE